MTSVPLLDLAALSGMALPQARDGDKETRGRVLVIGGSLEVAGAVVLAGLAGLRVGAGKLQVAAAREAQAALAIALPEARVLGLPASPGAAAEVVLPLYESCSAAVLGPGLLDEAFAAHVADALLGVAGGAPLVLDAAALPDLKAERTARHGRVIVTPHAGEMAKLADITKEEVLADPAGVAATIAARYGAVVAMKGGDTFVVGPDARILRHAGGVFGLATSGSGDVLAGAIAGLAARGLETFAATAWGVYLHGRAGARLHDRIGPVGFLARELLDEIAPAMAAADAAIPT